MLRSVGTSNEGAPTNRERDMPRKKASPETRKLKLAYRNMIRRCSNPNDDAWRNYGGRGIEVCEQWRANRDSFIAWAEANGHNLDLWLDRIDVNGNYCPENCRWATPSEQARNRRVTLRVDGVCLADLTDATGVAYSTAHRRLRRYGKAGDEVTEPGRLGAWRHGTRQGYEFHKCRCPECRAAHAAHHRKARARRKERRTKANTHPENQKKKD